MIRHIALAIAVLLTALPALAQESGDALGIVIKRDVARTPIAVPDFATLPGESALGSELAEVVRRDLAFTDLFRVLDPAEYPEGFTGFTSDARQIDFGAWRRAGAEFVVHSYVYQEGPNLVAECRLFDTAKGSQVVGKRLSHRVDRKRRVVHTFADDVVLFLTGERGIATTQLAFSGGMTGSKEIYVADYDGANLRPVTEHGSISILPRFSPDGGRIAYVSYKDRYPFLYVLELETGVSTAVSKAVGLNVSPAWSPGGDRLALVLSKDANAEIYLANADGSNPRRLTNDDAVDTSPAFHPDGQTLAFVSDRYGSPQVFRMGVDGDGVQRLSFQGGRSYSPAWSPDGSQLAYVVEQGRPVIWVMDADGQNARPVSSASGSNESPSWSPDGRHLVFASNRTGLWQLWTVNVESGTERRVPGVSMRTQAPSWGPRR
jgi:TolB protein